MLGSQILNKGVNLLEMFIRDVNLVKEVINKLKMLNNLNIRLCLVLVAYMVYYKA